MSRPSFQFYPGDWQKNANLRRCSQAARGVWVDILCLLHDVEGEYGVLRWPLKDIANAASAPMPLVRELVAKGVLKGADKGAEDYVYRPKHAGKLGEPVILVTAMDGPVWYSSRFVRDEYVRQRRGESTRFDTANQPDIRSPKAGLGDPVGDGPSSSSSPSGRENTHTAGTALPENFALPKAWGEWAIAEFPHWTAGAVRTIAAQFADHCRANGTLSLDWAASWRKWCRDELTQRAHPMPKPAVAPIKAVPASNTVPSNAAEQTAAAAAAAEAERLRIAAMTPEQRAEVSRVARETAARMKAAA